MIFVTRMSTPTSKLPLGAMEVKLLAAVGDEQLARHLEQCCTEPWSLRVAPDLASLDPLRASMSPDVILVDGQLLGDPADGGFDRLLTEADATPLLLLAPSEELGGAFELLGRGGHDVLTRPPHPLELRHRVARALEARELSAHLATLEDTISERSRRSYSSRTMVMRSAAMRQLCETAERVAAMRSTVLVLGESGVGKELVARNIHFNSPRADAPFIAINCAAMPPHLIESELFGHEKGAFTGAVSQRAGKFELAHGGTVFLDEIGETDLSTQAKLLRVIENQEFMRVGGSRPINLDVRLVAATNADLEQLVQDKRFREDLYYRLKVVTLRVPPLRERRQDIGELVETTLQEVCRENRLRPRRITARALDAFRRYPWPGNVRELRNTIEAVVVASTSETIDTQDLPAALQRGTPSIGDPAASGLAGRALSDVESEAIRATLALNDGSRTETAKQLGIGVRTLRRRIKDLGIDRDSPPRPGRPRQA
jgi:DNA-binding NtrC family response regulator